MAFRSELVLCLITRRVSDNSSKISGYLGAQLSVTCEQSLVSVPSDRPLPSPLANGAFRTRYDASSSFWRV